MRRQRDTTSGQTKPGDNRGKEQPVRRTATTGPAASLLELQQTGGNRLVTRMLAAGGSSLVQRVGKLDMTQHEAALGAHIGGRARQQALMAENGKHGQGMAEGLVQDRPDVAKDEELTAAERADVSKKIRLLVDMTKFDDASDLSVLAGANKGGLSDEQMWRLVVVNSEMMTWVKEGLVINKIIPDSTIRQVLKDGSTFKPAVRESIGGSVAHESNYEGLSGEEAVSNFGLDYGGYTDKQNGKTVPIEGGKAVKQYGAWGGLSSYVEQTAPDKAGRTLASVPNVFYVNMALPARSVDKIKVPFHANVLKWATYQRENLATLRSRLDNPWRLQAAQSSLAGSREEIEAHLDHKLAILDRFLERAFAPGNMAVSVNLQGEKNPEDPLTNLGITKPGSRLQNRFGTINQEYHFGSAREEVPVGSGIWLKGAPAKPGAAVVDVQVAALQDVPGKPNPAWIPLPGGAELIAKALAENEAFHAG